MKKTLLIDARTGGDWSLDLLFAGLVKRLGFENVIDFPTHTKHREGEIVLTGDPEKDWGRERRSLGYTPYSKLVRPYPTHELKQLIIDGEIERIFLDERLECYQLYLALGANFFDIPVVVVAGHDRFMNDFLTLRKWYGKNLEHIFVDNWRPEYAREPKTSLFNWSINFDHYWDWVRDRKQEKIYDISFMGYNSHPDRARFVDHIEKYWGHLNNHIFLEREPNTMRGFIPKRDYFKIMAQSKICLNLRGAADNGKTLRFYEIPYVGSLMVTQDSRAEQLHPFKHKTHCLYFKNEYELDNIIEVMTNPELAGPREQIAQQGYHHALAHHTVDARTKQMYEVLDGQS